ncbi:MAG: hypothetical protein JW818_12820, partial [Pirellulales bacterium]|nr:hypothetical protein [Pirellulales bacterium]
KTALHLINCVDKAHPNLAITGLEPVGGTRAANVELTMEVRVHNYGESPVRDVSVIIEADGSARPPVKIQEIPPGREEKASFKILFPVGGDHRVTVRLEHDAIRADNYRHAIVSLPPTVPVLIIDGDPEATGAKYLSAALSPGLPVQTGISPRIETPNFLSLQPLDAYHVIYLTNVDRLNPSALEALEKYVSEGGGLAVFLGPNCRVNTINDEFYRDGKGFFPMPVDSQAELFVDRVEKTPDLDITDHPIFKAFQGGLSALLSTVNVYRYFAVPKSWQPAPKSGVQVIARLRNGAPLAVERKFGRGRVIALTTTAAPTWNNWGVENPTFPVTVQELQAYLARRPDEAQARRVGSPLELRLPTGKYQPRVRFTAPEAQANVTPTVDATPADDGSLKATLLETDMAGVYTAELSTTDGQPEVRRFAFNVDTEESDLETVGVAKLADRLKGVTYQFKQASSFQAADSELGGHNLCDAVLYLLILMMIAEQLLAYSCSYHPSSAPQAAQGGSR